jgi:cytochrome c-type biogenesis protein CcmH
MKFIASFALTLCIATCAFAVEPNEMLEDPALELRAREVSQHLRCVQCQNEAIDESDAQIARDMRILVRQRITGGDSNEEIIDYMVSRYGDYVLLKPRFQPNTLVLWLGPFVVFLLGGWVVARRMRAATNTAVALPLSEEERALISSMKMSGDDAQ